MNLTYLTKEDFLQRICGNPDEDVSEEFDNYFFENVIYMEYAHDLTNQEFSDIILNILRTHDADDKTVGTEAKKIAWTNGWGENLAEYETTHYIHALVPKYYRPSNFLRMNGEYIIPTYPDKFEYTYVNLFRLWMFHKYFADRTVVYEFGCGSGDNLAHFCRLYKTPVIGLDYTQTAVDLINLLSTQKQYDLKGLLFDMTSPDYSIKVPNNSALFTMGALEQIPVGYEKFVSFIQDKKFSLCMHIEPLFELYDPNNLSDHLAMQFHTKRNYIKGFIPLLKRLELEGKVEIITIHRPLFGNMMQDSWSYIIWRPL